jgi:hypothetical protein
MHKRPIVKGQLSSEALFRRMSECVGMPVAVSHASIGYTAIGADRATRHVGNCLIQKPAAALAAKQTHKAAITNELQRLQLRVRV